MRSVTLPRPWRSSISALALWLSFPALGADPAPDSGPVSEEASEIERYSQTGHFPEELADADGDGVPDIDDNCPGTVPIPGGSVSVDSCGCPVAVVVVPLVDPCSLDSDHDGVGDCQDRCPNTYAGHRVGPDGCPLPLSEPVRLRVDVKFDFDRAHIKPGFEGDLIRLREALLRYPEISLRFEGHTDFTGTDAYNLKLSKLRAQACRDFVLKDGGIDPARVEAVGFGEKRPIADNHTSEGRAQNRRTVVEFSFEHSIVPANDQPPPMGTLPPEKN